MRGRGGDLRRYAHGRYHGVVSRLRQCWKCGYDLAQVPGDVCPECGSRWFDPAEAIDPVRAGDRRVRWIFAVVVIGAMLSCCLWSRI